MKYVVVVGLILLVFWAWRSSRKNRVNDKSSHQAASSNQQIKATQIVACKVCGLHLPHTDAVAGKQGLYCSIAHRQQADD
jgi:uncharacterized protein